MMRVIRIVALSLGLLFQGYIRLYGSNGTFPVSDYIFENIEAARTISPNHVEAFEQDNFGFIWMGATDGLYRYDGIQFNAYTFRRNDPYSICSNAVSTIFSDSKGNLWVGTQNGLNLYNVKKDNFTRYTEETGLPDNNIRKIAEDKDGNLWIATREGGVVRKEANSAHFTKLEDLLKGGEDLLAYDLRSIFLSRSNMLWIATIGHGVLCLSLDDMVLKKPDLKAGKKDFSDGDIRSIGEDAEGTIWIGTNGEGLLRYFPEEGKCTWFSSSQTGEYKIESDYIWDIKTDQQGLLWVATDGGGLLYKEPSGTGFSAFRYSKPNRLGINSDAVRIFFEDRAGNFWIGHYNAPIDYVNTHRKMFHSMTEILGPDLQNEITAILEDEEHNLWYATDGSGLILDKKGRGDYQHFVARQGSSRSILGNKPLCLEEDRDGNIWIGYYDGGISCYQKQSQTFVHFAHNASGENQANQVWDLLREGDTLWIASEGGVHVMNLKSRTISQVKLKGFEEGFPQQESLYLLNDSKGRLLIATYNGLYVYDRDREKVEFYTSSLNDLNTLSDKWVTTLFEDSKNRIWIGTNNGLNLWDKKGRFIYFTVAEGLAGNSIASISEDPEGNLWISTNQGISKFNFEKNLFTNYTKEDGLQGNSFRPNACFCNLEGVLFFGGNEGVTNFKPDEIQSCRFSPPLVFTNLKIMGRQGMKQKGKASIKENIVTAREIHLYPGQNIFTLDFASLNYTQGHRNQYMYRLEGFEDTWQKVGDQHFATYSNLAPGTYVFHVKGSNHDGVWNHTGASIKVIVHPPFYKTVWFIGLMVALVALVIFSVYRIRVRHMSQQNSRLARQVSERTRELEKRSREIADQNERIIKQRDLATIQRDQIVKQNKELELHRTRLEELVEERTQDLVAAKEIAEESDRLKTAFLENLSHEIRTPMNAIIGFVNLLTEKIDDRFSREYYLRIINESGKSMLRLIQDIVDFSRMQTGQLQPEYGACNLNDLLRDLISTTRAKASREKPELNILANLPDQPIVMYTDGKKLYQIFSKLLENSIKYTEQGYITVGIDKLEEKWITFFVKDTGIGIKPEHINKIFDRFFTVAEDDKPGVERGSGLGLAFAKVIAELLGGKIWAESRDDSGSTFYFTLPFKTANLDKQKSGQSVEKRFSWSGKKILVAEDEESNFLLIEAILRDTGVSIIHCEDGVELLEKVDDGLEFDLVLLDLKMPRMGGINAMKLIRESNKDIPVIVQTAYDQTNHRKQCLDVGCNDFLVKPLRKMDLLETIEKYLG